MLRLFGFTLTRQICVFCDAPAEVRDDRARGKGRYVCAPCLREITASVIQANQPPPTPQEAPLAEG